MVKDKMIVCVNVKKSATLISGGSQGSTIWVVVEQSLFRSTGGSVIFFKTACRKKGS